MVNSSSKSGWTIPRAALVCESDVHRSISPACTKYQPQRTSTHVPQALMVPRRSLVGINMRSDPGQYEPKSLPQPKLFVSKLTKSSGSFLSKKSDGADFMMHPKGIGELRAKGGLIPQTKRFTASTPQPSSNSYSVLDLPPPSHPRGVLISKTPLPRGGGTKLRPTMSDPAVSSAFDRCAIPDVSFAAARFATRSILMDHDMYDTIDDPKLRADEAFLKGVREDIARWKLKSALH